jgi:hypothetical protein
MCTMHIALAPFTLKHGVTEETLLKTSDEFETSFVRTQDGIHRRILVQDTEGGYAEIVFFENQEAMARVMEAEQNSDVCAAFFAIMNDDGIPREFKVLKTYE